MATRPQGRRRGVAACNGLAALLPRPRPGAPACGRSGPARDRCRLSRNESAHLLGDPVTERYAGLQLDCRLTNRVPSLRAAAAERVAWRLAVFLAPAAVLARAAGVS